MKSSVFIIAVIIFAVANTYSQNRFSTYNNERFAYSIEYPSELLKMQPPPENGDGREFDSDDSSIKMRVWGNFNSLLWSWKQWYESDLKDFGSKPTYTVWNKDWYVISGVKEGRVFYQKTMRRTRKDIDILFTFTIEYPASDRSKLDPIVMRISRSFRFDSAADV